MAIPKTLMKAFLWEGEVKEEYNDKLVIVIVFAECQTEAIDLYRKHASKAVIEIFSDLVEWTFPLELSQGFTEVAQMLLFGTQHTENSKGISSLYRYSPERMLYILAKTHDVKPEPKKVNLDSLEDFL